MVASLTTNPMYLHNTIATHRKTWALTQPELGSLLDTSRSNISRFEVKAGRPSLPTALALEALFGASVSALFPDEFRRAAADMLPRIAAFSIALERQIGEAADRKRALLADVVERLSVAELGL